MTDVTYVRIPKELHDSYMATITDLTNAVMARPAITIATEPGKYVIQVREGGGFVWQTDLGQHLDDAVGEFALWLAEALGLTSEPGDDEGPWANDADAVVALRRSYPAAAVIAAVAEALEVHVPTLVAEALTDCEPLPAWRPPRPAE